MHNHPAPQRRPLGVTPSPSFQEPPREGQRESEYGFSQECSRSIGGFSEPEMHDADVSGAGSTVTPTGSSRVHRDSFLRQVSIGKS